MALKADVGYNMVQSRPARLTFNPYLKPHFFDGRPPFICRGSFLCMTINTHLNTGDKDGYSVDDSHLSNASELSWGFTEES